MVIIAYFMSRFDMPQADVMQFIQSKQKIKPRTNFTRQLQVWKEVRYQVWENEDRTVPKPAYKAFLEHQTVLLGKRGLTGNELLTPQNL